ncbi:hypothetical protein GW17_00048727 [Ensete ventricosum]|nr:hypothetical protein GW17_00048727 [Ensete ventricosum]
MPIAPLCCVVRHDERWMDDEAITTMTCLQSRELRCEKKTKIGFETYAFRVIGKRLSGFWSAVPRHARTEERRRDRGFGIGGGSHT